MKKLIALTSVLLVAAMVAGCGGRPDRVEVSGKVTLDGQPLPNANIHFRPMPGEDMRDSVGSTDENGEFVMNCFGDEDGVPPGEYRVAINAQKRESSGEVESGDYDWNAKVTWLAPAKYATVESSGLTATVEKGMEPLHFELKSE